MRRKNPAVADAPTGRRFKGSQYTILYLRPTRLEFGKILRDQPAGVSKDFIGVRAIITGEGALVWNGWALIHDNVGDFSYEMDKKGDPFLRNILDTSFGSVEGVYFTEHKLLIFDRLDTGATYRKLFRDPWLRSIFSTQFALSIFDKITDDEAENVVTAMTEFGDTVLGFLRDPDDYEKVLERRKEKKQGVLGDFIIKGKLVSIMNFLPRIKDPFLKEMQQKFMEYEPVGPRIRYKRRRRGK